MTVFTHRTRLPLERAIEVFERVMEPNDVVLRKDLHQAIKADAPEAGSILDHTIKVMIHGGYVRRIHLGPDRLAYEKTDRWQSRNETLLVLRAPHYKKRFRPRIKGKLVRPAASTVDGAKALMRAMPAQADMFGAP